jgi:hypothetical protein
MELSAMTNMMINLKLAEQRQIELATEAAAQRQQPKNAIVRLGLIRSIRIRLAMPRRSRPVQPAVNRMVRS